MSRRGYIARDELLRGNRNIIALRDAGQELMRECRGGVYFYPTAVPRQKAPGGLGRLNDEKAGGSESSCHDIQEAI